MGQIHCLSQCSVTYNNKFIQLITKALSSTHVPIQKCIANQVINKITYNLCTV